MQYSVEVEVTVTRRFAIVADSHDEAAKEAEAMTRDDAYDYPWSIRNVDVVEVEEVKR